MSDALAEVADTRGIGDNSATLEDLLLDESASLAARRDELLGSANRAPAVVGDETTSQRVADLVRLISACMKNAEAARVSRKEPFLASGRLCDAVYKRITDPLDKSKRTLEQRLTLYQRQKAEEERRVREAEARRQAEDAERQGREAEAAAQAAQSEQDIDAAIGAEELARQAKADAVAAQKAAEVKPAELSRTRGDYGAVASLRTFWDFTELDREAIDLETLRAHLPVDAIEKAIRSYIRAGGRHLRGCKIFENTATSVR